MTWRWILLLAGFICLIVGGCAESEDPPINLHPVSLPSERDWKEGPFEKVHLCNTLDGKGIVAEVFVKRINKREKSLHWLDAWNGIESGTYILEGNAVQTSKVERRLPDEVHQPKGGQTFRIGSYHLIDEQGQVISSYDTQKE